MNPRFLLGWALSATALALVFLGYAIGIRSAPERSAVARTPLLPQATEPGSTNPQIPPAEPYAVPDALGGLPSEWHSVFDGETFHGYAILFDPQRREFIVEQCRHLGYIDKRTGDDVEPGWEFCHNVLWATVTRIDEQSATVIDRAREPVELAITVNKSGDSPRLSLSFRDHEMMLQPGSKNDYLQAMERSPAMQTQKDRYLKTMVAREQALRRMAEQTGTRPGMRVPTYSLPAGAPAQDEDRQVQQRQ